MNEILKRAFELEEEMFRDRRHLHQYAEVGLELPLTASYVKKRLEEMGYRVINLGASGLLANAGQRDEENTILLRADMDALPMQEESGLFFTSVTEAAHCCGHDLHTAMLLAAARMLKERESELKGCVRLLFQPGEEVGTGALEMLKYGILTEPVPAAVLGLHVNAKAPLGRLDYGKGCTFSSNDNIDIEIKGQGGHGARPHEAIDPIKAAIQVYLALQTIRGSEVNPLEPLILTITAINGGNACNLIPNIVTMKGTLRTYNEGVRQKVMKRISELCANTAGTFGAEAKVTFSDSIPSMYCSPEFTDEILTYAADIVGSKKIAKKNEVKMGSEDFSFITKQYPDTSGYLFIGAGIDEAAGYPYGQHSPKVVFNENVMPYGAAVLVESSMRWLSNHSRKK